MVDIRDADLPAPVRADASFDDLFPERARRAMKWRLGLSAFALTSAGVLAWVTGLPNFPTCAFKMATGHPCPGCGMTRSITTLVRGDLIGSLRMHPLGIVLFGLTAALLVGAVVGLRKGRDPVWELIDRRAVWFAVGIIVSLFGLWIIRGYLVPDWSPDPVTDGMGLRRLIGG